MHNIFTRSRSPYREVICKMCVEVEYLISKCLNYSWLEEIKNLQKIEDELISLLIKGYRFDFISELAIGKTLLVGEGNLSFTLSLTKKKRILSRNLIATTFETKDELSQEANENKEKLKTIGTMILHGIDATKLYRVFNSISFNNIVFQFPHSGSREPVEGHNPNFILVRDFLRSAKHHLNRDGKIFITAVDNPHYNGAFQFYKAASEAGFQPPTMYTFDPSEFFGYNHAMTNEEGSAIEGHDKFGTWVFRI